MISKERKQELANEFRAYMERYLDKQWIDSDAKDNAAENDEELDFLKTVQYWITVAYNDSEDA